MPSIVAISAPVTMLGRGVEISYAPSYFGDNRRPAPAPAKGLGDRPRITADASSMPLVRKIFASQAMASGRTATESSWNATAMVPNTVGGFAPPVKIASEWKKVEL